MNTAVSSKKAVVHIAGHSSVLTCCLKGAGIDVTKSWACGGVKPSHPTKILPLSHHSCFPQENRQISQFFNSWVEIMLMCCWVQNIFRMILGCELEPSQINLYFPNPCVDS